MPRDIAILCIYPIRIYVNILKCLSTYLAAIGCSNLVPPEDTWLRRNGNEATLGCYTSQQTWHLCCTENHWIGVIGNCSRGNKKESIF